jgi:hypothetical protein
VTGAVEPDVAKAAFLPTRGAGCDPARQPAVVTNRIALLRRRASQRRRGAGVAPWGRRRRGRTASRAAHQQRVSRAVETRPTG